MRVRNWNPKKYDAEFAEASMDRLRTAAKLIAAEARNKLINQIGKGVKETGISRPIYQSGPYAGQRWTGRNFGNLLKSIRVVEKKEQWGFELHKRRNIRVYAGNYLAYYAKIFEFSRPFMRPGWRSALPVVKNVIRFGTQVGRSRKGESSRGYAHAKGRAY